VTQKQLRRAFLFYNRKYFGNNLPKDTEVGWKEMPATLMGWQQGDEIAINAKLKGADVLWRATLIHECVHLELPAKVKHGPRFRKRMRELAAQGAFDGLI
jgi:hypothetical protein